MMIARNDQNLRGYMQVLHKKKTRIDFKYVWTVLIGNRHEKS